METVVKIAGLCLAVTVVSTLLRRDSPELGLLLVTAAALLGGALVLDESLEIASLWDELTALTGLAPSTFAPLLKVTAIALVVRIGGALCADAGQSALARILDAAGAFCALGCTIPLLRSVIDLIKKWI